MASKEIDPYPENKKAGLEGQKKIRKRKAHDSQWLENITQYFDKSAERQC